MCRSWFCNAIERNAIGEQKKGNFTVDIFSIVLLSLWRTWTTEPTSALPLVMFLVLINRCEYVFTPLFVKNFVNTTDVSWSRLGHSRVRQAGPELPMSITNIDSFRQYNWWHAVDFCSIFREVLRNEEIGIHLWMALQSLIVSGAMIQLTEAKSWPVQVFYTPRSDVLQCLTFCSITSWKSGHHTCILASIFHPHSIRVFFRVFFMQAF